MKELDPLAAIARRHGTYPRDAYRLVLAALEETVRQLPERRHISGQELLAGLSHYARATYGPLARFVLNEWGVRDCMDFGRIVFHLVEAGQLSKTDEDSLADFAQGYDFSEEFDSHYDWLSAIREEIGLKGKQEASS